MMSRCFTGMTAALVIATFGAAAPTASAGKLSASDDHASAGPLVLAQSSGRLGNLQTDGISGDRGLNDGLDTEDGSAVFDRRGLGTFNSNRLGRMRGHGLGTMTGHGLGTMTGSGLGTMTGSGLGTMTGSGLGAPSGQGLGSLAGPGSSPRQDPVQRRNATRP